MNRSDVVQNDNSTRRSGSRLSSKRSSGTSEMCNTCQGYLGRAVMLPPQGGRSEDETHGCIEGIGCRGLVSLLCLALVPRDHADGMCPSSAGSCPASNAVGSAGPLSGADGRSVEDRLTAGCQSAFWTLACQWKTLRVAKGQLR